MSLREAIERRLAEVRASTDPRPGWVWRREVAQAHGLLTLYTGWTAIIGIRPDGSLAEVLDETGEVRPVDGLWARVALCAGARAYPELAVLLPVRPPEAEACSTCGGSGTFAPYPDLTCQCGGLGWLLPGEEHSGA